MALKRKDNEILEALQLNGRISNVELAELVHMSESPCYRRVRALEEAGVIEGYNAKVDQRLIGLQVTAFVLVTFESQDDRKIAKFLAAVETEPYIIEAHAISGSYDFLLKVVASSMDHFSKLARKRILKFPGVKNIESNFSLEAVKENAPLPLG